MFNVLYRLLVQKKKQLDLIFPIFLITWGARDEYLRISLIAKTKTKRLKISPIHSIPYKTFYLYPLLAEMNVFPSNKTSLIIPQRRAVKLKILWFIKQGNMFYVKRKTVEFFYKFFIRHDYYQDCIL